MENLKNDNLEELWRDYEEKYKQAKKTQESANEVLKKIAKILCFCYKHDTDEWLWDYCSWRMTNKCPLFQQKAKLKID